MTTSFFIEKYDRIGINYDETRKADPYLVERLFRLLAPQKEGKYADIGCGTGNYTIALNQKGVSLIGFDPSDKMLQEAASKNNQIVWRKGRAEDIPLENSTMDGVIASLTIHHWRDLEKGFGEIYRILKPNGTLVIFTSTPQQMGGYWLNHYFPKMLEKSIIQMPALDKVEAALIKASFEIVKTEKYFIHKELEDLFLYAGKQRPHLYLNPSIRKGISSFSDLANKEEVEIGLTQLKKDIQTKAIQAIIKDFENNKGDYLFIVARKID